MSTKEDNNTNKDIEQKDKASVEVMEPVYPYGLKGPTQEEIDALKEKYGVLQLIELAGSMWIYRQMKRAEHLDLLEKGLMDVDSDALVVQTLLVWPDPQSIDWTENAAGIVPSLSADMLAFSGFVRVTAPVTL